jgi:RNA polymerase sigma-70 factor (ECF subfamily)
MARREEDWAAVLDRLCSGDRAALLQLARLINSFLARWNAYDFRDDWEDLIQEVVLAAATALREGKLRERGATFGYLRTTARFKFVDRLKRQLRVREDESLPWADAVEKSLERDSDAADPGLRRDLRSALEALPEKQRVAVIAVHVRGQTFDEAAAATKIPLGSLKRYLRDGLAALRAALGPALEEP